MESKKTFSKDRVERLKKQLKSLKVDGCLIETPLDLFYLTGLTLSAGKLIVLPQGAMLFVDGRYVEAAQKQKWIPTTLDSADALPAFLKKTRSKTLAVDPIHTSYERWARLQEWATLKPCKELFAQLRSRKEAEEIKKMTASARLLWKGFEKITQWIKTGITERELAKKFEIFCLQEGADGLSFEPIIAFGKNSAMPHYRSQKVPLKRTDHILVDIGVVVDGYHSDMTRVLLERERFHHSISVSDDKPKPELCCTRVLPSRR